MDADNLYKVRKREIPSTGAVFAAAFRDDPVWKAVLDGFTEEQRVAYFEGPARYCRKFGTFRASSELMEGCAGWVRSKFADMTIWRGMMIGSLSMLRTVSIKLLLSMAPIFAPLEQARRESMGERDYIYLIILGVAPEHQGKGHGGRLLRTVLAEADSEQLPVFLETATETNIAMYERFGFQVVHKVMHPVIDIPQFGMVRESGGTKA